MLLQLLGPSNARMLILAVVTVVSSRAVRHATRPITFEFQLEDAQFTRESLRWRAAFSSETDTAAFGIELQLPTQACCHPKDKLQGVFLRLNYSESSLILFDLARQFHVDVRKVGSGGVNRAESIPFVLTLDSASSVLSTSGRISGEGIIAQTKTRFLIRLNPMTKKGEITPLSNDDAVMHRRPARIDGYTA